MMVGMNSRTRLSQRRTLNRMAKVAVSVAKIETTPEGMFSRAETFGLNPRPLMSVALNVVITPDGMTTMIVINSRR